MQDKPKTVVVLGTGGTIAGTAASATDNVGYTSAQVGVGALVAAVPALAGLPLESEQVAQNRQQGHGPRDLAAPGAAGGASTSHVKTLPAS